MLSTPRRGIWKEANVARTEDSDDVIGVRVLGGFLLDFYKHANVVAETGHTPYYKRILFEIKSCFKSVTSDHDEACFKAGPWLSQLPYAHM